MSGIVTLPNEVLVTLPDVETVTCECGAQPVMIDRFTVQVHIDEQTGTVRVEEPMFGCRECWNREVAGTDGNYQFGVIPFRITF